MSRYPGTNVTYSGFGASPTSCVAMGGKQINDSAGRPLFQHSGPTAGDPVCFDFGGAWNAEQMALMGTNNVVPTYGNTSQYVPVSTPGDIAMAQSQAATMQAQGGLFGVSTTTLLIGVAAVAVVGGAYWYSQRGTTATKNASVKEETHAINFVRRLMRNGESLDSAARRFCDKYPAKAKRITDETAWRSGSGWPSAERELRAIQKVC